MRHIQGGKYEMKWKF